MDLADGAGSGGDADGDTLARVEDVVGSAHADRLTGDDGPNLLRAGDGNDVLIGNGDRDRLYGDAGDDTL